MYSETFIKQYLGRYLYNTSPDFAKVGIIQLIHYADHLHHLFLAVYIPDRTTQLVIAVSDFRVAIRNKVLVEPSNLFILLYT